MIASSGNLLRARPEIEVYDTKPKQPSIIFDQETGEYSTVIRVMTYNIEGLPWPVRQNRESALADIEEKLKAMHVSGSAPDIVLIQEAFTEQGMQIGKEAGYRYVVRGPDAGAYRKSLPWSEHQNFDHERSFIKGERSGKVLGSGLAVFSDYQITQLVSKPFRDGACGGYDCLANKGMVMVRVAIPGVPVPLDIFTTHLNSRGSSGVPAERSLVAYQHQIDDLADYIKVYRNPENPLVMGGDFNFRNSTDRLIYLQSKLRYTFSREYCQAVQQCLVDTLAWEDHQDHQLFDSASLVRIEPIAAESVFDAPVKGRVLSDHNDYVVVYRISWKM